MKSRLYRAVILILMMFGHNYVLNQAQSMQTTIQELHDVKVTEFNFLYSIPSAVSIFFIIPLGILYDNYAQKVLLLGAFALLVGQILVTIFGPNFMPHSYLGFIIGRVFQGNGAEVLYMIQGNLASTWMSNTAGMIFILPEIGQIFNVILTPLINQKFGILTALLIGLATCIISFVACILLYRYLKKSDGKVELMNTSPSQMNDDNKQTQKSQTNCSSFTGNELISDSPSYNEQQKQKDDQQKEQQSENKIKSPADSEDQHGQDRFSKEEMHPKSIVYAGKVFWLTLAVCTINQCLYFPFLDNANVLIQTRFCVPNQKTGIYLCLPFLAAMTTTFLSGKYILENYPRYKLIFAVSLIPFLGHLLIYLNRNCDSQITLYEEVFLVAGLVLFGMGLGSYYSISFPAVGLAVPKSIRGTAYALLCFCQTISMTLVPQISGVIIEDDEANNDNFIEGYQNSSFFFVVLCFVGVIFSFLVYCNADQDSFSYDDYQNLKNQSKDSKEITTVEMQVKASQ